MIKPVFRLLHCLLDGVKECRIFYRIDEISCRSVVVHADLGEIHLDQFQLHKAEARQCRLAAERVAISPFNGSHFFEKLNESYKFLDFYWRRNFVNHFDALKIGTFAGDHDSRAQIRHVILAEVTFDQVIPQTEIEKSRKLD